MAATVCVSCVRVLLTSVPVMRFHLVRTRMLCTKIYMERGVTSRVLELLEVSDPRVLSML